MMKHQEQQKITAIILTKNEEDKVVNCISSLSFCDQVIVIDDNSVDKTVSLARKSGARVYVHSLSGDFSKQRNFGLSKTRTEWALFIDADELVPKKLALNILHKVKNSEVNGYYIYRQDVFLGKVLVGSEFSSYKLRLGRVRSGNWSRSVHEEWNIGGKTEKLKEPLLHYSHDSIHQFIKQIAYFSNMHAKAKESAHESVSFFKVLVYPLIKFLYLFIARGGYKDGIHGFVANAMMSFHSFLAWSHLYLERYKK